MFTSTSGVLKSIKLPGLTQFPSLSPGAGGKKTCPAYLAFHFQPSVRSDHQPQLRGFFQRSVRQQPVGHHGLRHGDLSTMFGALFFWGQQIHEIFFFLEDGCILKIKPEFLTPIWLQYASIISGPQIHSIRSLAPSQAPPVPQDQGLGEAQVLHTPGLIALGCDKWTCGWWGFPEKSEDPNSWMIYNGKSH